MSGRRLNTSPETEAVTGLASRRWIFVAQDALVMPRNRDGSFRLLTRHENGQRTRLHRDKFRIGTINASTMVGKEEEVVSMMRERTLDVLGVCETRMEGEGRRKIHDDYQLIYKGRDEERKYGVALFLTPDLADRVEDIVFKNERMIAIALRLKKKRVGIIQVYAPHQGRPQEEKNAFYEQLQNVYDGMNTEVKIVMGDLNAHIGRERMGTEMAVGAFGIGERNAEGERLLDFAVSNRLAVMNTYFSHRDSHKWTWYRWNSIVEDYTDKSMIDLILTNNRKVIRDVKSIPSVSLDSDHRLVVGILNLKTPLPAKMVMRERIAVERLKEDEVKRVFVERVCDIIPEEGENVVDVEGEWEYFRKKMITCARETMGVKRMGLRKKKTAWWTDEVARAVKEKNKKFRAWMKRRSPETRAEYVVSRNEAETMKRRAMEQSWERIGEQLRQDVDGTKKLIYNMAKNLRRQESFVTHSVKDKEGRLRVDPDEISDRWGEYFSELYNREEGEGNPPERRVEQLQINGDESAITMEELEMAMGNMKNGKSPGCDGLPVETMRCEEVMRWMLKMFNDFWRVERVPAEWGRAIVCPVFKKGDRGDCSNYRGISLLPHAMKLYERILEKRLRTEVEDKLNEAQYGFRPGRGTTDLIFSLKMMIEKSWEWDREMYVAFVDLEKAFDSVPRVKLWETLEDRYYQIEPKLIRVIRGLYTLSESAVRTAYGIGQWFGVRTGVRQGGVLSPLLFILYMDKCMREIGVEEEEETVVMAYADDIALVARDRETLQNVLIRWEEGLRRKGLRMNLRKTVVMKIAREGENLNIEINGEKIEEVGSFKYLGVTVNSNGTMEGEIEERIRSYSRGVGQLYPLLRNRHVTRQVKTLIYTTILRPVLLFGSESWTLTTRTRSRIVAAEMRVLRLIVGVTRRERRRNAEIRGELGVEAVEVLIERQQLRWYGHIRRMDEERYPARFYAWRPAGRRPAGRPRKRWKDGVAAAVARRGWTLDYVEEHRLYEERVLWRSFANDRG